MQKLQSQGQVERGQARKVREMAHMTLVFHHVMHASLGAHCPGGPRVHTISNTAGYSVTSIFLNLMQKLQSQGQVETSYNSAASCRASGLERGQARKVREMAHMTLAFQHVNASLAPGCPLPSRARNHCSFGRCDPGWRTHRRLIVSCQDD